MSSLEARSDAPAISVVIPYFNDDAMLDLVLTGLEIEQGVGAFEVVIADDGSSQPPKPGARPYPVRIVRHDDLGNRTGSARNLGARAARGALLVFVDGDTVPAPGFLAAMAGACEGRHLTVGRRRHAELGGMTPTALRAWLGGTGPSPTILDEPRWLADGYAATDDLRDADLRSYRYVISAVLACPRERFFELGGFAEELVGYGGEDWEFARRAWLAGTNLRHAPSAVGWHDGPDLAGRGPELVAAKNAETVRIAHLLTDPALRGEGLIWEVPRVVVRRRAKASGSPAAWIACAEALLRACPDLGVWTNELALPVRDPRIRTGLPGAHVTGRAELILDLEAPVDLSRDDLDRWHHHGPVRGGAVMLCASPRDRALGTAPTEIVAPSEVDDDLGLEAEFGRRHAARRDERRADG